MRITPRHMAQQLGGLTAGALSNRQDSQLGRSLPYALKDVAHASRAAATGSAGNYSNAWARMVGSA